MNRWNYASLMLCAGLLIGTLALGQSRPASSPTSPPTKLAVVDFVQLVTQLDQWADDQRQAAKLKNDLNMDLLTRQKGLKDMESELEVPTMFKKGSPEYKKIQDDYLLKGMEALAFNQYAQKQLILEMHSQTADIYHKANAAVASYARDNGIALVLLAQDEPDFNAARSPDEALTLIRDRKVIHASPDFDITRMVVAKMNDEYSTLRKAR